MHIFSMKNLLGILDCIQLHSINALIYMALSGLLLLLPRNDFIVDYCRILFFSINCSRLRSEFLCHFDFFSISLLIFHTISPYEVYGHVEYNMTQIIYWAQFFILGSLIVLSHAFFIIYDIHRYTQLVYLIKFKLYYVRKKA